MCQFNTHDTPLIANSIDIVVDNKWIWYSTTFTVVAWMTPDNWQHVCTEWFFLYCTYSLTKHCTLCLEKGSHLIFDNKNVDWFFVILSPTDCLFWFIVLNFTKYREFVGRLNLLQKLKSLGKSAGLFLHDSRPRPRLSFMTLVLRTTLLEKLVIVKTVQNYPNQLKFGRGVIKSKLPRWHYQRR